jgi:hypothetical protein
VFGLLQRVDKALNENKFNTALDLIYLTEKKPLLSNTEITLITNGKAILTEIKKCLENSKGKIIERVDKMLNNWLVKTKQDEFNMGLEIIEEINNDLKYIENDNPLAHLNQVVNTQPSRQTKNSVAFGFNPGVSRVTNTKREEIKNRGQTSIKLHQSIVAGRSLSKMFSLVGKNPEVAVRTDLDFQALDSVIPLH